MSQKKPFVLIRSSAFELLRNFGQTGKRQSVHRVTDIISNEVVRITFLSDNGGFLWQTYQKKKKEQ